MSLKKKAIGGVQWTTTSAFVITLIQLIQLSILTRLLSPSDFGLMALVLVVTGFSQIFIDMGFSNAIIYKQDVTSKQLSSLYWINIITGILFFILITVLSPLVSKFYHEVKLVSLIDLLAITFLIKPFGQQFMVLLQKELRFDYIAKSDMFSKFISFVVVVVMAYKNFGVYSLAVGSLVFSFFSTLGYIVYGIRFHRPKFYFNIKGLREYINFGLFQMGERILQYFAAQIDTILIGKLLGIEILGIYNVAKSLASKPKSIINPVITRVTFPLMAKVSNDIKKLKDIYLQIVNYLSLINFPIYFYLLILAKPIVIILFGSKWTEAIPIVQILSLTFLLRSIGNPAGSLLLALGKANTTFYWSLITFGLYPISIFMGSYWGIIGITIAILILHLILFILEWKFIIFKNIYATFHEYIKNLSFPFIFSIISMIIMYLIIFNFTNIYIKTAISAIIFSGIYILLNYKYNRKFFFDVLNLLNFKNHDNLL